MKQSILAFALVLSTSLFAQTAVPKDVAVKSFIELAKCAQVDENTFSADTWSFLNGYVSSSKTMIEYMSERMNDLGSEKVMAVAAELQSIDATMGSAMGECANNTTAKYSEYNSDLIERSWLTVSRADVPDSADHLALLMEFAVKAMIEQE